MHHENAVPRNLDHVACIATIVAADAAHPSIFTVIFAALSFRRV